MGAPYAKPHPRGQDSGSSYVVFGKASGFPKRIKLSNLDGTNGFRLDGIAADDRSGISVAGAGDVNGDGFDDVMIGSWASQYVVFGKASGFPKRMKVSKLDGSNGFRLDGVVGSNRPVAGAGDVNGDGFDDLITGSYGSTYVVFGKASSFPAAIDLSTLIGTNGFRLNGYGIGRSAAGAGDVNADGYDDVVVGVPYADLNGTDSGSTYVVFGHASPFAATIDLSSLNGENGFRLDGITAKDFSGFSVTRGGDVNGDGISDLLIGAPTSDPGGIFDAGSSYVLFGRASGSVRTRRGSAAVQ